MAINLSNNQTLSEVDGKLSAPGRIVQTVHTVTNSGVSTSSTSPVDIFTSNPITMTNASNKLVIEFQSDNRSNDWGDGVWNLHYMDIIHVGTGTQLSYSGYNGEVTYCIRGIHRVAVHSPGSFAFGSGHVTAAFAPVTNYAWPSERELQLRSLKM